MIPMCNTQPTTSSSISAIHFVFLSKRIHQPRPFPPLRHPNPALYNAIAFSPKTSFAILICFRVFRPPHKRAVGNVFIYLSPNIIIFSWRNLFEFTYVLVATRIRTSFGIECSPAKCCSRKFGSCLKVNIRYIFHCMLSLNKRRT